jgi:CRISPR-associated protein Csx17
MMEEFAKDTSADLKKPESMRSISCVQAARVHGGQINREWIDASIVFSDDFPSYPAIFGSGGNEGSGSYLANYYVAITAVLIEKLANLDDALWNTNCANEKLSIFLRRNDFNCGHFNTRDGEDCPWTFVLAIEGVLALTTRLSRRMGDGADSVPGTSASMASPFAVGNSCAGYNSAVDIDSKTRQSGSFRSGRGEQWFPLWESPCTYGEVQTLFQSGRVASGGNTATRGLSFAQGIARLGCSRGVRAFERVGYFQRKGGNHMAVPLGRFEVAAKPHQALLDEVVEWIDRLRWIATDKNAPESFDRVHRACEEAVFQCTRTGRGFLPLLIVLAKAEDRFLASPRFAAEKYARPIPKLSSRWLTVIRTEDDSHELQLATALASQYGKLTSASGSTTIRRHWVPVNRFGRFESGESGLAIGPEQAAAQLDLQRGLIATMHRRLIAYSRGAGGDFIPLRLSSDHLSARLADIQAFLQQSVDDGRILAIARALMAIDFSKAEESATADHSRDPLGGLALYGILRLALPVTKFWVPEHGEVQVRCNPTIFHRLRGGDVSAAVTIAARQLSAAGLRPRLRLGVGSPALARRLAASMAFGISRTTMTRLALGLTDPQLAAENADD